MILDNIMDFVLHKGYHIRVYDFVQNSLLIRCGNKLFPKFSYETFSYSAKKKKIKIKKNRKILLIEFSKRQIFKTANKLIDY